MPHIDVTALCGLRAKIGVSQARLARLLSVSLRSVTRWEATGNIGQTHLALLLSAAELVKTPLAPIKLGRPPKRWYRYKARRHYDYGRHRSTAGAYDNVRYWLWLPGHVDHCCAIQAPPTGIGDSWLLRSDERDIKYRYVRTGVDEQAYAGKVQFDPTLDKWVEITKT